MNKTTFTPFFLILPGLLLTIAVISYPVLDLIRMSLYDVGSFGDLKGFSGVDNYIYVFNDPLFWESLVRTLKWTVLVVGGAVSISLPIALILNEDFYGRSLARTLIMLPWSISLAMTAVIWKWLLNPDFGMLNKILNDFGYAENPGWLSDPTLAFYMQVFIGIVVSIPFTVSIFLGGLSSIPYDIYEAAYLEGSNFMKRLQTLTLPLLKSFISIAVVLNVIYVFNSFPIIWVLTEGGPSNSTDILPTYLYKMAFRFGEIGPAAAISLIMLVILLVFTFLYAFFAMKEKQ